MPLCIVCNKDKEKLFKNNTCSFSCNKKLHNKVCLENGTHNFITNSPNKIKKQCDKCNEDICISNFVSHYKICAGIKYCKNCLKQITEGYGINFCSSSCSATFNNKIRPRRKKEIKISTKEAICQKCNCTVTINKFVNLKNFICLDCKNIKKVCKMCNKSFLTLKIKQLFCSKKCASKNFSQIGCKVSRSKNEIYFSELCKKEFTNVLENEKMFNGWDADVILPDLKIAIFWNGMWHYSKLRKDHDLVYVQHRDKLKEHIIRNHFHYDVYIIKDPSSENKKFVEQEFNKFMEYMRNKKSQSK